MVFIGDVLASEEEYVAGPGTFVDDDGNIKASVIGKVFQDDRQKEITVLGKLVFPKKGDTAIAVVNDIREKVVLVTVIEIFNQKQVKKKLRISSLGIIKTSFPLNLSKGLSIKDRKPE